MVPLGMDRWASFKSPDLLEPAIIPIKSNTVLYWLENQANPLLFHVSFIKVQTCNRWEEYGK